MCVYVKKLTDISQIDEYIWIHVIDIYDMKNMGKYSLSLHMSAIFQWIHHEYLSIQILLLLGSSSSPTTQIAGTSDMIHESTITPDATSGR